MPYGDPQSSLGTSIAVFSIQDSSGTGEYPPQMNLTTSQFGAGEATVEEAETLFQKILGAITSHPDLVLVDANRTYQTSETITPE